MNRKPPIRLTNTSYVVLSLLDVLGEATPYDLKHALEVSVENFWPVPHTSFYEEPARLAGAGYLSVRQESAGRRRKRYTLTDSGRATLRAWADSSETSPPQLRDEGMLKIFAGADPRPILSRRATWQRGKLAELEGYLAEIRAGGAGTPQGRWRGAEATLIAGVAYHRRLLALTEEYLQGAGSADQAATETAPASGKRRRSS
jgi:DNA-binding PadR family transcriptional regulator